MGADAAPHAPAGAMSPRRTAPCAEPPSGPAPAESPTAPLARRLPRRAPPARPPDDREKRKRNLVIIAAVLFLLVAATAVEVGIRMPDIPVASNVVVIALFNLNLIVFLLLPDPAVPQPGQAVVRAPPQDPGLAVQDQARRRVPVAGPGARDPDLPDRVEPHQHVDRGVVPDPGRAPARRVDAGGADLLRASPGRSGPPRPVRRPHADARGAPRRGSARGPDRVPPGAGRAVRPGRCRRVRRRRATRSST